jgi:peptide/nickel transport system permease protein
VAELLLVEDLVVDYLTDGGPSRAVDQVSFAVAPGEIFGLCGESGSGKSTLALALPRLLPPPALITGGRVLFEGRDLATLKAAELQQLRGAGLGFVPQSGMNALNPLLTVQAQIVDGLMAHGALDRRAAGTRARELLVLVGLDPQVATAYPHQLSGGMRQRVVMAIALGARPRLLVLDEPTSALDVLLSRQIGLLLCGLAAAQGFAVIFISHDLPLLLALCTRVGVLHRGRLVEVATTAELRARPQHPYTAALLGCFLDPRRTTALPPVRPGGEVKQ